MSSIKFTADILPPKTTAQQKGVMVAGGKPRFFEKKKIINAKQILFAAFYPHKPETPLKGALRLRVKWFFPYRKSEKKSVVKNGTILPHTVRPDLDNLEKSLLDVLTDMRFWEDDSQVFSKTTDKYFAPAGKITVEIEEVIQ